MLSKGVVRSHLTINSDLVREQARRIAQFQPDRLIVTEVDPTTTIYDIVRRLKDSHNLDYSAAITKLHKTPPSFNQPFTFGRYTPPPPINLRE